MPPITCHILDTTKGKPAADVTCAIYYLHSAPDFLTDTDSDNLYETSDKFGQEIPFAIAKTNNDGRIPQWIINKKYSGLAQVGVNSTNNYEWESLKPGIYKIRFHTKHYFLSNRDSEALSKSFFPFVDIHFVVSDPPDKHYHIPLLLSNHSYTTYRGS